MRFDWSLLGRRAPTMLAKARALAHHAAQWPTRAARANLAALPDDSHSSLTWDGTRGALLSQPMAAAGVDVRVGLRVAPPALLLMRGGLVLDTYELAGRRESMVGVWLDSALRALALKPAGGVALPYTIPSHAVARGSAYNFAGEADAFEELAHWFAAAADLLETVRAACAVAQASAGPVLCWPHHFDVATVLTVDAADGISRSIGLGLSPGDHYYAQPYVYVSPTPHPDAASLPALPPPGHWHTQGFFGAVATAEQIFTLTDRRAGLFEFVRCACETGGARLDLSAGEALPPPETVLMDEPQ